MTLITVKEVAIVSHDIGMPQLGEQADLVKNVMVLAEAQN
jgi:hypothetical protein